jgi:sterol desaturase/sphingolipid hydroxylase (fatty acid hydroxylase superfamily)
LVAATVAYMILPWYLFVPSIITMSLISFVNVVLHDSFHIKNHWLKRYRWHRRLAETHFIHHRNIKKNLGIYFYLFDRMSGSFKRPPQKSGASGPSSRPS